MYYILRNIDTDEICVLEEGGYVQGGSIILGCAKDWQEAEIIIKNNERDAHGKRYYYADMGSGASILK